MFSRAVSYTTFVALLAGAAHAGRVAAADAMGRDASLAAVASPANEPAQCGIQRVLASGIDLNIMVQRGEVEAINNIAAILKAAPVNMGDFMAAKNKLLSFIMAGIGVRQTNQMIAPMGNAAAAGLAFVANAQLEELALAMNLTGDPTKDNGTVTQLQQDFGGGIKKNMENQQMAIQGCAPVANGGGGTPKGAGAPSMGAGALNMGAGAGSPKADASALEGSASDGYDMGSSASAVRP